jgi:Na+/melibiose symporter-like transporter
VSYSLPSLPLSMLLAPIIIYLPAFYATQLGMNLSALGVIFFIGRLWDGIADPIVGRLSDLTRSRFGRRKPWVVTAMPFLVASTYFLCRPPANATVTYLLVTIIIFYVCYTAVRIPYISWGAELSSDYRERTRIAGSRELGSMFGIFISVGAPYFWLTGAQVSMDNIMQVFTTAVFLLLPPTVLVAALFVSDRAAAQTHSGSLRDEIRSIARNKPFMRIMAAQSCLYLGTYVYNACLVFLVEQRMRLPNAFLSLLLIEYIAMMIVTPLVTWLAGRLSKHRVMALGVGVQVVAHTIMAFVQPQHYWQAALAFALIGVSLSSWYVVPTSLIADSVDYGKLQGGSDSSGFYMALFNFVDKAALALGALLALPLLDYFGFKVAGPNSAAALDALRVIGCFAPIALIVVAAALYWNYPLTSTRHRAVLAAIQRRERRSPPPSAPQLDPGSLRASG